ncbi:MAG: GNAT family N-acetyltransferase [Pseudomonadota bacterium]
MGGCPAEPGREAPLTLRRDDALGPEARALIAESEAEQAAIYPPEFRFAFSPDALIAARTRFLVGYRNGRAIACGGVAPCDGYGELKRIFVTRSARGSGAADAILAGLETEARAAGLDLLRLETGEDSPAALKLYARLGYHRRGPFGAYAENGSSVFMEKRLTGSGPATPSQESTRGMASVTAAHPPGRGRTGASDR